MRLAYLLFLAGAPTAVFPQISRVPAPGDRVTIATPALDAAGKPRSVSVRGRLELIGSDSVILRDLAGGIRRYPRGDVLEMKVSAGRHRPMLHDAVMGGVIGAAIGAVIGLAQSTEQTCKPLSGPLSSGQCTSSTSRAANIAAYGGALGAAGGLVGFSVGALGREKWVRVDLSALKTVSAPVSR